MYEEICGSLLVSLAVIVFCAGVFAGGHIVNKGLHELYCSPIQNRAEYQKCFNTGFPELWKEQKK